MKIQLLDRAKKKKFVAGLEDFGLAKIRELLIRTGKERVRAYSGSLSTDEIMALWKILPVEGIGLYVGKDMVNRNGVREVRLSLDGLHTWKDQITGNVFQLSEAQEVEWFAGKNVDIDTELEGFVAVKSSDGKDFVGMGKVGKSRHSTSVPLGVGSSGCASDGAKVLFSFLPKERRRKERN